MQHARPLPPADEASREHSRRCAAWLRNRIADAGGSIGFAEFMHHALYAPGLGYYAAGTRKFGAAGDYVTAPEISPLFGRTLARQCAGVLRDLRSATVLEFGAGSGKLAVDLLGALDRLDALPQQYAIVEVSPELRERQQRRLHRDLPGLAGRVAWLDRLPDAIDGIVVANEVLDALPVERFRRTSAGVEQFRVAVSGEGFIFVHAAAPPVLADAVTGIEADLGRQLPDGYVSEVCLAGPGWIGEVASALRNGTAFLFDYGVSRSEYYAPDRSGGWLRCHFRHRVHDDPLALPGIQDLTAWVDFSAVAGAAAAAGCDVAGYVSQAHFLLGGGLEYEIADLQELPLQSQLELAAQVRMLTLPGEMGENVKCLGLSRGSVPRPAVFTTNDRTHTL